MRIFSRLRTESCQHTLEPELKLEPRARIVHVKMSQVQNTETSDETEKNGRAVRCSVYSLTSIVCQCC